MLGELNKLTILGSGTSVGIPMVGCQCKVCLSKDSKDKRLRSSIIIKSKSNKNILVDMGPDLRTQLLRENIRDIDSAILTHDHADHSHGVDDLRPFCFLYNKEIEIFSHAHAIETMTKKFPYIFDQDNLYKDLAYKGGGLPRLKLREVRNETVTISGEDIQFLLNPHGNTETLGLVHDKMAYIIDCIEIPHENLDILKKAELDYLIIDCLKEEVHQSHLNLDKALKYIDYIQPKFSGLTHLSHDFLHEELANRMHQKYRDKVFPVYDGQVLHY